jgi:SAM-dependent methyltransferase
MTQVTATPANLGLSFVLACPNCRAGLEAMGESATCTRCETTYAQRDGIWRFLLPARAEAFDQFVREYHAVRSAEGWGADSAAYYRALPWRDLGGRQADLWQIRARTFDAFLARLVSPLERRLARPLAVLDMGAGNSWLAYQLARRGHRVGAVDIGTDVRDGLGARVYYDVPFVSLQAEFDRLPLAPDQLDLIVYNASLHYSTGYAATFREALRVLHPDGQLVVLDSPLYRDAQSGAQMVREREHRFAETYGFPSNALNSEHYLTWARLDRLADELQLDWSWSTPFYGWSWAIRPWRARLRGRREPARFGVLVGRRRSVR